MIKALIELIDQFEWTYLSPEWLNPSEVIEYSSISQLSPFWESDLISDIEWITDWGINWLISLSDWFSEVSQLSDSEWVSLSDSESSINLSPTHWVKYWVIPRSISDWTYQNRLSVLALIFWVIEVSFNWVTKRSQIEWVMTLIHWDPVDSELSIKESIETPSMEESMSYLWSPSVLSQFLWDIINWVGEWYLSELDTEWVNYIEGPLEWVMASSSYHWVVYWVWIYLSDILIEWMGPSYLNESLISLIELNGSLRKGYHIWSLNES